MNEGVYGSFASKLSETLIAAPTIHKVSLEDSRDVTGRKLSFGISVEVPDDLIDRFQEMSV